MIWCTRSTPACRSLTRIGLLTVYDMLKAADRGMVIDGVRVLAKRGGKSGDWTAPEAG